VVGLIGVARWALPRLPLACQFSGHLQQPQCLRAESAGQAQSKLLLHLRGFVSVQRDHAHAALCVAGRRRHNEDEARDTFKTLKNQHVADSSALLFHAWASLEAGSGNTSKALGILGKALKENAQPARWVRACTGLARQCACRKGGSWVGGFLGWDAMPGPPAAAAAMLACDGCNICMLRHAPDT